MSPSPNVPPHRARRGGSASRATSAADSGETIVEQARDALATAIEAMQREGESLSPTVEEGELAAYDLDEYERPLVLLVPTGSLRIAGYPPTVTAA